jgi:hypothetical protein
VVDSVAALMEGLILWWFCGCDGGSIHCMWLGCLVLFCRREVWFCVKHGGKVKNKKKKNNCFIIF